LHTHGLGNPHWLGAPINPQGCNTPYFDSWGRESLAALGLLSPWTQEGGSPPEMGVKFLERLKKFPQRCETSWDPSRDDLTPGEPSQGVPPEEIFPPLFSVGWQKKGPPQGFPKVCVDSTQGKPGGKGGINTQKFSPVFTGGSHNTWWKESPHGPPTRGPGGHNNAVVRSAARPQEPGKTPVQI